LYSTDSSYTFSENSPKKMRVLIVTRNTELAQAVDGANKENLPFDVQSKLVVSSSRYFLKEIENIFSVFRALVKVWENSRKLWRHSPVGSCSHRISRSPTRVSIARQKHGTWFLFID